MKHYQIGGFTGSPDLTAFSKAAIISSVYCACKSVNFLLISTALSYKIMCEKIISKDSKKKTL